MEKNRGYSMPLLPNKRDMWGALGLMILAVAWTIFIVCVTINEEWDGESLLLLLFGVSCSIVAAGYFLIFRYAQLHFVPEGVAVTIFGLILKQVSKEKIRLITGARSVYKGSVIERIALCDYSLEELTAHAYKSKPKLFRNSREFRTGEWADDYLTRMTAYGLIPDRRIFLLRWDPERAEALRRLYPDAQWMDLTKDKIFDKQLNH